MATTCVSAPVGSTTSTTASSEAGPVAEIDRCSGRMPSVTFCPSAPGVDAGSASDPPFASSTGAPPSRRSVPSMKFMAGEPMKPATKRFEGWS